MDFIKKQYTAETAYRLKITQIFVLLLLYHLLRQKLITDSFYFQKINTIWIIRKINAFAWCFAWKKLLPKVIEDFYLFDICTIFDVQQSQSRIRINTKIKYFIIFSDWRK